MLITKKMKSLDIYIKTLLLFVMLILPLYLISYYINILSNQSIKEKAYKALKTETHFIGNHFNTEIEFIQIQLLELFNSNNSDLFFNAYDILRPYDKKKVINNIEENLRTLKNSSPYISNAGIISKQLNRSISCNKGLYEITNHELDMLESYSQHENKGLLFYFDSKFYLIKMKTKNYAKGYDAIFIELSTETIQDTLKQLIQYKNSGCILLGKIDYTINISTVDNVLINQLKFLHTNDDEYQTEPIFSINQEYLVSYEYLPNLDMTLYSFIAKKEITGDLRNLNIWFIIFSVISFIVITIYAFSIKVMIHKPLFKFINAFKLVEANHLDISIPYNRHDEFSYLYKSFEKVVHRLRNSIRKTYEQELLVQKAELKQLQSQINPHFLYNSFFNIYRMCKCGDYETVEEITQKLGSYFQFITRNDQDDIPLSVEIKHARDYLDIQQIRFSNSIVVEMEHLPSSCSHLTVPRLILQPVIENVYEHGLNDTIEGGKIIINFSYHDHILIIQVDDNGKGLKSNELDTLQLQLSGHLKDSSITGLINISTRLRLKYGQNSGVYISLNKSGGITCKLKIDYKGVNRDV